jgi:NAD+-dependent secondary alcohol dehydrogenase Adh1
MRAVRLHEYGQPPRLDDVPEPVPCAPDDVVIRIAGTGVCRTDLHIIDGWFADVRPAKLPLVLGHENAGWVHAVGPAVADLAVGDPVICYPDLICGVCRACRAGEDTRCIGGPNLPGLACDGGMAELFKTRARAIVKLPGNIAPAEVASLADAGLTAYYAVKKAAGVLGPGSYAVAIGIGGVGHIAVQCLKAMTPAQVVAVDVSEDALRFALHCGADHIVNADGRQGAQVRDLTGMGADAVFDFVGEDETIGVGIAMLRPGGCYFPVGYGGTVKLPCMQLVLGEITVAGNLVGTKAELAELVGLVGDGKVVQLSGSYPLEAGPDVLEDMRRRKIRGRAILIPGRQVPDLSLLTA